MNKIVDKLDQFGKSKRIHLLIIILYFISSAIFFLASIVTTGSIWDFFIGITLGVCGLVRLWLYNKKDNERINKK